MDLTRDGPKLHRHPNGPSTDLTGHRDIVVPECCTEFGGGVVKQNHARPSHFQHKGWSVGCKLFDFGKEVLFHWMEPRFIVLVVWSGIAIVVLVVVSLCFCHRRRQCQQQQQQEQQQWKQRLWNKRQTVSSVANFSSLSRCCGRLSLCGPQALPFCSFLRRRRRHGRRFWSSLLFGHFVDTNTDETSRALTARKARIRFVSICMFV